ncbi:MAG: ribonuclease P protein component [Mycobacteriaceae bacterium]
MLAAPHRLTHHSEFSAVVREGKRAGRSRVVVHALRGTHGVPDAPPSSRVGLVVSKSVGPSVVRHRVSRRLRHVMQPIVPTLPAGTRVVLRALASSSTATSAELDTDIRSALRKLGLPVGSVDSSSRAPSVG